MTDTDPESQAGWRDEDGVWHVRETNQRPDQLADAQARIETLERERDEAIGRAEMFTTMYDAAEADYDASADREANLRAVLADFCLQVELYATWPRGKDSEKAWATLCDLAQAYKSLAGDAPDVVGLLRTAVGLLENLIKTEDWYKRRDDFLDELPQQYRTKKGE